MPAANITTDRDDETNTKAEAAVFVMGFSFGFLCGMICILGGLVFF